MVAAGAWPSMVLRLSPVGCHVPPHGSRSAVDACHTPCVVAIAHDASSQRIEGHLLTQARAICADVHDFAKATVSINRPVSMPLPSGE
jgi:hypothetical protein